MACHEIAALRLWLMKILGRNDEAERQHELAELGDASHILVGDDIRLECFFNNPERKVPA